MERSRSVFKEYPIEVRRIPAVRDFMPVTYMVYDHSTYTMPIKGFRDKAEAIAFAKEIIENRKYDNPDDDDLATL